MAKNEEKEHTKFIGKKDIDVPGLEPTHVGYFRRLAKRDGTEPARAQYEGMSREKAEFLAGLDDSMDMYGVNYRHPKGWQLAKLPVIPRETYSAIGRLTCGLPSRFSGCRRAAL